MPTVTDSRRGSGSNPVTVSPNRSFHGRFAVVSRRAGRSDGSRRSPARSVAGVMRVPSVAREDTADPCMPISRLAPAATPGFTTNPRPRLRRAAGIASAWKSIDCSPLRGERRVGRSRVGSPVGPRGPRACAGRTPPQAAPIPASEVAPGRSETVRIHTRIRPRGVRSRHVEATRRPDDRSPTRDRRIADDAGPARPAAIVGRRRIRGGRRPHDDRRPRRRHQPDSLRAEAAGRPHDADDRRTRARRHRRRGEPGSSGRRNGSRRRPDQAHDLAIGREGHRTARDARSLRVRSSATRAHREGARSDRRRVARTRRRVDRLDRRESAFHGRHARAVACSSTSSARSSSAATRRHPRPNNSRSTCSRIRRSRPAFG